jgi:hypothetical protein
MNQAGGGANGGFHDRQVDVLTLTGLLALKESSHYCNCSVPGSSDFHLL